MTNIPVDLEKKLASSSAEADLRFKQQLKSKLFKEKKMPLTTKLKRFARFVSTAPALAVFAAVIIVGSASALVSTQQANTARNAEVEVPSNLDDLLNFEKIRAIASSDVSNGNITSIELEKEDSGMIYKVRFSNGDVRFYDAKTGASMPETENNNNSVPSNLDTAITSTEARAIAVGQRPGKAVTKIELETENGIVVYSVRFSDGGRVDVNSTNGEVVRVRAASTSGSGTSDDSSSGGSTSDSNSDDSSNDLEDGGDDSDNSGSGSSGSGSGSSGSGVSGSDR